MATEAGDFSGFFYFLKPAPDLSQTGLRYARSFVLIVSKP
jgi:hypothetical protein